MATLTPGWESIPSKDEAAIKAAWISRLQPDREIIVSVPSRTWRGKAFAQHRLRPELEDEFTTKLLAAFRRCTRIGERLWAIDWQHAWYFFDPHIASNKWSEWPMKVLSDGDSYNYVAPDFRFGIVTRWQETGPVTLFGTELLIAFDADPPREFIKVCGQGKQKGGCKRGVA